eukprot:Skav212886  [mRNA]  locus=scaffold1006:325537:326049:+ [translate_table: standard]
MSKLAACFSEKDLALGHESSALATLKEAVPKEEKPSKPKDPSGQPEAKPALPEPVQSKPAPADSSVPKALQVGMVVTTTSGKCKDKFDQQKGKIVKKVLKNEVVVDMISGPGKGESKKFKHAAVLPVPEDVEPAEDKKRPAENPPQLSAADAKRQRAEQLFKDENLEDFD